MTAFAAPTTAWHRPDVPGSPLVVLLHGRGADEGSILGLASHLPPGASYVALRAPISEGGGHAWFANRGIGRPVAGSLADTMGWFHDWLDGVAPVGRPVVLVGFSGGAAFAGGLLLSRPERFAGGAVLYGTLPFDAGVPVVAARLAGLPVFVAQGETDTVIPRELLQRTWSYLLDESGAPTYARRDPGGHQLTSETAGELAGWLGERLAFLAAHGNAPDGDPQVVDLPSRRRPRPEVSWRIPQQQLTDLSPVALQARLRDRVAALPAVTAAPSAISVPGARGFRVEPVPDAPVDAFLVPQVGEFAHQHPEHDGSLHVALPPAVAKVAVARGWAVAHPLAGVRLARGMVLVYGPRDEDELDVVTRLLTISHRCATGEPAMTS